MLILILTRLHSYSFHAAFIKDFGTNNCDESIKIRIYSDLLESYWNLVHDKTILGLSITVFHHIHMDIYIY